jgi:hypothetical protein
VVKKLRAARRQRVEVTEAAEKLMVAVKLLKLLSIKHFRM